MSKKSIFAGRVRNSVQNQDKQKEYGYVSLPDGLEFFDPMKCKPKDKDIWSVTLDFLPYKVTNPFHPDQDETTGAAMVDTPWFRSCVLVHNNIDNNKELCLKTIGKPCPICDYQRAELDKGAEWNDVKDLKASKRDIFIVVPINSDEYDEKPYLWDMSQYLFSRLLQEELVDAPENEVFPDLEEGKSLKIRFTAKEFKTGGKSFLYPETSRIDFKERKKQYGWDFLEEAPNLDELLQFKTYKDLEAKLFHVDTQETEETKEKEEETPAWVKEDTRKPKDLNACPHGHTFGKDWDDHDECKDCVKNEDCAAIA